MQDYEGLNSKIGILEPHKDNMAPLDKPQTALNYLS